MGQARILVVEDEAIVAMDLKRRLEDLGYAVVDVCDTGEAAIRKATEIKLDLVLMDICLPGDLDGVDAGGHFRSRLDVPVVYITSHSDDATVARAKVTEPFGYIIKPFDERELKTTVEIALYKSQAEQERKQAVSGIIEDLLKGKNGSQSA